MSNNSRGVGGSLCFSHSKPILPKEADHVYICNERKADGSLLYVTHALSFGLRGFCSSGFDLEPSLQCDLSGLAELRCDLLQKIAQ